MRFYAVKITTSTDGVEARDLRGFDTLDEAKVRFHADLSNNINKDGVKSIVEMIINSEGGIHANEKWALATEEDEVITE